MFSIFGFAARRTISAGLLFNKFLKIFNAFKSAQIDFYNCTFSCYNCTIRQVSDTLESFLERRKIAKVFMTHFESPFRKRLSKDNFVVCHYLYAVFDNGNFRDILAPKEGIFNFQNENSR